MIPLRDDVPSRGTPIVNYAMIAACGLVFLAQLKDEASPRPQLVERYGMIPARVRNPDRPIVVRQVVPRRTPFGVQLFERERRAAAPPVSPWVTLLTCVFLHGGWMHFLGNMWILYIFGDNVEDRFGHVGYLIFYLLSGLAASATHLVFNASSTMPTIGASGAIAGVMGAYFILYPRARVLTLVPIFYFVELIMLPAPLFLGIWFFMQFLQGTASITSVQTGGVAWWAHIGGFVAGMASVVGLRGLGLLRPWKSW
jgi:hypothetical protein